MKTIKSSEKGQIVVLLALALIGLLGFTALAVDGGMIFADQRYSQSAADAASLAGGGAAASVVEAGGITIPEWQCSSLGASISGAVNAAIAKAGVNDYVITQDNALGTPGHDHGVKVSCSDSEDYIDVEVMLSKVTNTSFVHLFTGNPMRTTVYSKTRVKPQLKAGNGAAIVSLGLDCKKQEDGGVHFDSGSLVTILTDGGVYSNSCVTSQNQASVTITGADVNCHKGFACEMNDPSIPLNPESPYHPLTGEELYPWLGETCGNGEYVSAKGASGELYPGNYSEWDFKDPVHLNPGLYCVNGVIKMNAGGEVFGTGVTIYYTGTDMTLNGHLDTELAAPDSPGTPPENGAVEDVLVYVPMSVTADIKINGNSGNEIGGTIYAPESYVHITGTSDSLSPTEMNTSIIGKVVWVSGNSYINIAYDDDMDAGRPAWIQVQK